VYVCACVYVRVCALYRARKRISCWPFPVGRCLCSSNVSMYYENPLKCTLRAIRLMLLDDTLSVGLAGNSPKIRS